MRLPENPTLEDVARALGLPRAWALRMHQLLDWTGATDDLVALIAAVVRALPEPPDHK